jgi:deazaflavin-dependent oxidoreductase (nitroreductase family)
VPAKSSATPPFDPVLAAEDYCYLTTTGRVTGKPHTVEIWFGTAGHTIYVLAGGRYNADFVKNAMRAPDVPVRFGKRRRVYGSRARVVRKRAEDALARRLLLEKYSPRYDDLDEWGRDALPVAFDLEV